MGRREIRPPEEIKADELSNDLPAEDLPIPDEVILSARKNLLLVTSNREGVVITKVVDSWGNPTGITIEYREIFGQPVLNVMFNHSLPKGAHLNLTAVDSNRPVTIACHKFHQEENGSKEITTTRAVI